MSTRICKDELWIGWNVVKGAVPLHSCGVRVSPPDGPHPYHHLGEALGWRLCGVLCTDESQGIRPLMQRGVELILRSECHHLSLL